MTGGFFDGTRPGERVRHGAAEFDLPILYFRDDAFAAFFTADLARVRAALPTRQLHPVRLPGGRTLLAVAAFNYVETSIGPYGEVAVAVPVVHGRRPLTPLPALREARTPGFGMAILHLPVTTVAARDAGRGVWGYAKFLADMEFTVTPERLACRLAEGGRHILTLEVPRAGRPVRDGRPLVTYSVRDGELVRTSIRQRALYLRALRPRGVRLDLGDHPVARELRALRIAPRPLLARVYLYRPAILPAGEVVARGVPPLDGYGGTGEGGRLEVRHLEG